LEKKSIIKKEKEKEKEKGRNSNIRDDANKYSDN
jgi:hypothetical protein